jgi:preprotein translocase subunit SecF
MKAIRLFPNNMNINFLRHRVLGLVMSSIIILGTFGLLISKGLNFGIDFTGGMMIEVQVQPAPDLSIMREDLNALNLGDIAIQ